MMSLPCADRYCLVQTLLICLFQPPSFVQAHICLAQASLVQARCRLRLRGLPPTLTVSESDFRNLFQIRPHAITSTISRAPLRNLRFPSVWACNDVLSQSFLRRAHMQIHHTPQRKDRRRSQESFRRRCHGDEKEHSIQILRGESPSQPNSAHSTSRPRPHPTKAVANGETAAAVREGYRILPVSDFLDARASLPCFRRLSLSLRRLT